MKKLLFMAAILLSTFGVLFSSCNNDKSTKTGQLAAGETYTCNMHNEVISENHGKCPKCGMNLQKQKMTDEQKRMKESGNYVKPDK